MVQIFSRLRNNLFYVHYIFRPQVFSVTHHLLLNYNARFIHFYLHTQYISDYTRFLFTPSMGHCINLTLLVIFTQKDANNKKNT
jgi:hypothetical protein